MPDFRQIVINGASYQVKDETARFAANSASAVAAEALGVADEAKTLAQAAQTAADEAYTNADIATDMALDASSQLTTHKNNTTIHVTQTEKTTWNNKLPIITKSMAAGSTARIHCDRASGIALVTVAGGVMSSSAHKGGAWLITLSSSSTQASSVNAVATLVSPISGGLTWIDQLTFDYNMASSGTAYNISVLPLFGNWTIT